MPMEFAKKHFIKKLILQVRSERLHAKNINFPTLHLREHSIYFPCRHYDRILHEKH